MNDFQGKTAVITGGGSGIGRGIALAAARRDMNVVVADIESGPAETVAAELKVTGARALPVATDVADLASMRALADTAIGAFGAVHLLCNNAGVLLFKKMTDATPEDWEWILSVNLGGVVNGLLAFLPHLRAAGGDRHIVNTASVSGLVAFRNLEIGLYNTSKYAVMGLSESLRNELAPEGIGVSVLCPGGVNTRITDAERNRPRALGGRRRAPEQMASAMSAGMDPETVGEFVFEGIARNELYLHTHAENRAPIEARFARILKAFEELPPPDSH